MGDTDWHRRLDELATRLPGPPDERYPEGLPFVEALRHGSMSVELFSPGAEDRQEPHAQDELYLVTDGRAAFVRDGTTVEVAAGDVLFVPAGMSHRFVEIGPGFRTWVVFWGPQGGEGPADGATTP